MTIAHRFAAYIENKKHRKLLFWSISCFLALVLGTAELAAFLPVSAAAASSNPQQIDEPLVFKFFGSVDFPSVKVTSSPAFSYKLSWKDSLNPFENKLLISPEGVLKPSTTYRFSLEFKDWLGQKKKFSWQTTTSPLTKVSLAAPKNGQSTVLPSTKLAFDLEKDYKKGSFVVYSEPSFETEQVKAGKQLLVYPKTKLLQGQKYEVYLFLSSGEDRNRLLYNSSFTTLSPLELTSSTPASNTVAVSKKSTLTFTFNKPVKPETLTSAWKIVPSLPATFTWKDPQTLEVSPNTLLQSATVYKVNFASSLSGVDGSQLLADQEISFTTAGAVKVLGISPSSSYAALSSTVAVNFDQEVDHSSAQAAFSISPSVTGSFYWRENSLSFKPNALSMLTNYKITLTRGIKSTGGDDSTQDFSASFTTTGERSRTIGYSVRGRAISATYFGTGPKKILLVGCMHGSECNTAILLNQWISYLRANQNSIGSDRTFIIVPLANPDGKAASSRFNANNVDLNRNWDASWQAQTYWQNGSFPTGGGSGPFSEPESSALRDLILSENPVRIVSYHSAASLVVGFGISTAFRDWYAGKSSYATGSGDVESFGYPITGTLEEWGTIRSIPAIVVELSTTTFSEYERNLPALKGLLTLAL